MLHRQVEDVMGVAARLTSRSWEDESLSHRKHQAVLYGIKKDQKGVNVLHIGFSLQHAVGAMKMSA